MANKGLDSGIDKSVTQVDQTIQADEQGAVEHGNTHNDGVITVGYAGNKKIAEPGDGEDVFDYKAAGQQPGE